MMKITLNPITPDFVAEIGDVDLSEALPGNKMEAIKDAFWKYSVLIFPEQRLNQAQHLGFAEQFGPLVTGSGVARNNQPQRLRPELADISNMDPEGVLLDKNGRLNQYQLGNRLWHTDASFRQVPALCSLLYANAVVPIGGHTEFADQRAAYEDLSPEMKEKFAGKVAEHSIFTSRARIGMTDFSEDELKRLPPVAQAMVRTLPQNGRKTLYVPSHAGRIFGMPLAEGKVLIDEIMAHSTRRQYVYTHRWRVNDLVMWDNRCTLHRGTDFDETRWKRDMQRATVLDVANSCEQEGISISA